MRKIKDNPWLLFIIGLILGILAYSAYSYLNSSENDQPAEVVTQPATFQISPYNHLQGSYDAPVTLVVFNDFTCPYCQDYFANLQSLMANYNQDIRLVWKHFPLNSQELSPAIASECADEQGQFWPYANLLSSHPGAFNTEFYLQAATDLNLDQAQFSSCLQSDKYEAKVQADYYEGIIKGVIGAPATFINGEYLPGLIPLERLVEFINDLI